MCNTYIFRQYVNIWKQIALCLLFMWPLILTESLSKTEAQLWELSCVEQGDEADYFHSNMLNHGRKIDTSWCKFSHWVCKDGFMLSSGLLDPFCLTDRLIRAVTEAGFISGESVRDHFTWIYWRILLSMRTLVLMAWPSPHPQLWHRLIKGHIIFHRRASLTFTSPSKHSENSKKPRL